jgi:hypothetical protein
MQFWGRLQIEIVDTFLLASPYMSVCLSSPFASNSRIDKRTFMKSDILQLCYFCPNCNLIREPGQRSQYSNWDTGWTIQGSNLCMERYFSPGCGKRLWGPPSLLFNWYRDYFPRVKRPKREVGYSKISRVNVENEWGYTSIPCMPTWREEGRLHLYLVRSD